MRYILVVSCLLIITATSVGQKSYEEGVHDSTSPLPVPRRTTKLPTCSVIP